MTGQQAGTTYSGSREWKGSGAELWKFKVFPSVAPHFLQQGSTSSTFHNLFKELKYVYGRHFTFKLQQIGRFFSSPPLPFSCFLLCHSLLLVLALPWGMASCAHLGVSLEQLWASLLQGGAAHWLTTLPSISSCFPESFSLLTPPHDEWELQVPHSLINISPLLATKQERFILVPVIIFPWFVCGVNLFAGVHLALLPWLGFY